VYASLTDASTPWVQSVPSDPTDLDSSLTPFYNPQGSYITYQNKNYYSAENNLWTSLYYQTTFNPLNGPTKVSPDKGDSPFVISSVLEKTELVTDSWQGAVPDPYYEYYTAGVPAPYRNNLSYMRGAVVPYTEFAPQYQVDDDDSSPSMGVIFKREPVDSTQTVLVAQSTTTQSAVAMTSPYVASPSFGRPEVIQLEVLSVQQITLPKEGVSVLQLTNNAVGAVEYVRVISLNSNVIQAIRNYYPEYASGTLPAQWPAGTTVKACVSTGYPEPSVYDPDWAVTKATMFRFFQLMGYAPSLVKPYMVPKYSGERTILINSLPLSPINGYANVTTAWPIEFNNPSSIIANTHTWQYVGYLDYSRGLPKYQVNEISKKLSYDYLCTTSWGGRLTVMGSNEQGQLVFLGPIKEALTGQFYVTESPLSYAADRQVYKSPDPVVFPNPVLVYSTDDISGDFDGSLTTFPLTRGTYPIPSSQLSTFGVFVFLGGVVQKPGEAYTIQGESAGLVVPQIVFSEAPAAGTSCDIRIVSSDDEQETVEVIPFALGPAFDGVQTSFAVSPDLTSLTNLNSFVFLGGVEQNPSGVNQTSAAYTIDSSSGASTLSFIGGAPQAGTTLDFRGILSGSRYRNAEVSTVFVSSVDDIAPLFNNTQRTFALEIDGVPLDPTKVNAQNMFVSLGGVMQIPVAQTGNPLAGLAYTVAQNPVSKALEITFATPPAIGTTCNIRVITSDEFLTCPLPPELFDTALQDGPGIVINENNQIIEIDSGLIG
jgi:guanyl-specific ribonuclease Sa